MKIESRKSINIRKIVEHLGTDLAANLPQIHVVTGFELLFYMLLGKLKFLKNVSMASKFRLLKTIGVSRKVFETDVEKFLQTVNYSGKVERVLTETWVRLYKQKKTKTSVFTTR